MPGKEVASSSTPKRRMEQNCRLHSSNRTIAQLNIRNFARRICETRLSLRACARILPVGLHPLMKWKMQWKVDHRM